MDAPPDPHPFPLRIFPGPPLEIEIDKGKEAQNHRGKKRHEAGPGFLKSANPVFQSQASDADEAAEKDQNDIIDEVTLSHARSPAAKKSPRLLIFP